MTERLCPRCGSELIATATPSDQTPTPGRLDRLECPALGCDFVTTPEAAGIEVRTFKIPDSIPAVVEQIAIGAVEVDAAVKKGEAEANPEALANWATETAKTLLELAAVVRAEAHRREIAEGEK